MTGINDIRPSIKNDGHRNADKIRQDIAQAEQDMSKTVEEIGDRIKEKLDWQEYVRDAPYLAVGVAACLGYLAAGMFVQKRTPVDRFFDAAADEIRNAAGGIVARSAGPGVLKVTLLGIASKAAVNWLQNAAGNSRTTGERSDSGCCTTPSTEPQLDRKIID